MSDQEVPETAVVPVTMGNRGVALHNIDEAWRFCTAIEQSGVAPKGMKAAAIFAVVQAGAELGLTPFRALSNMKIINGRVGPMGALAKALVRKEKVLAKGTGFKEDFTGEEMADDWTAHFSTLREGESSVQTTTFSVKDAKRAALWGKSGPWSQYPKRMLMWRAVGFHMDDYYSDVLMGMHIAEVLGDYPDERIPATMEKLETPIVDPLLAELEATAATMQPPDGPDVEGTGVGGRDLHMSHGPEPIITDPIEVEGEKVDPATGEFQAPASKSPLEAVMQAEREVAAKTAEEPPNLEDQEMSVEDAMAALRAEGTVKEEDMAAPDPNNKAPQGADDDLF